MVESIDVRSIFCLFSICSIMCCICSVNNKRCLQCHITVVRSQGKERMTSITWLLPCHSILGLEFFWIRWNFYNCNIFVNIYNWPTRRTKTPQVTLLLRRRDWKYLSTRQFVGIIPASGGGGGAFLKPSPNLLIKYQIPNTVCRGGGGEEISKSAKTQGGPTLVTRENSLPAKTYKKYIFISNNWGVYYFI